MATVDHDALAQVLSAIDLRVGVGRREVLGAHGMLVLAPGEIALVYVTDRAVHSVSPLEDGCRLDLDRGSLLIDVDRPGGGSMLRTGDVFLTLGRRSHVLTAVSSADLVVVALELSESAPLLHTALPGSVTVTGFDVLEPAAAALAANMRPVDGDATPRREGDGLICRLMATTVMVSTIRAWAANGCAPEGWPRASIDPFLDRVVAAIHADPGHDWTLERLARLGAMSRSAFAERFRSTLGRSPADYVAAVRIEQAKRMLGAGRTVSETSRELGYTSDEGFSRAFRRRTGMNPSAWRTRELVPA
ncbi:helix-turn-helix transcriptional regulator [Microbacterium sp.]|uniref:helix-turn-helix transcriptional regulator n=1 Tax=Microbacterium sp. TaxID=51671 RepID=UPI0039E45906